MDEARAKHEGSMSNEELTARIQQGEREQLPKLWEQVERFAAKLANKWAWRGSTPPAHLRWRRLSLGGKR